MKRGFMAQKSAKGKKSAIAKKVIVKVKEMKKVKEIKKPVTSPHEFRMNIRCRRCFFVDGYTVEEKACHNCKEEIYEIDKI